MLLILLIIPSIWALQCKPSNTVKIKPGDSVNLRCIGGHFSNGKEVLKYKAPLENSLASIENWRKITCRKGDKTCYMTINMNFKPFVDQNVSTIINADSDAHIQCPIKAPNFPPYGFMIQ